MSSESREITGRKISKLQITSSELRVTNKNLEGTADMEQHTKINDGITAITQSDNNSPRPETIHGQGETNYSDANRKSLTKTPLVSMPNMSVSIGDTVDCGMIAAKEKSHELVPTLGLPSICELKLPSTPAEVNTQQHKDGHYFLKLLKSEQTRLLTMAEQAERDMYALTTAGSASDEIFGILRSVSGKTRLLVSQKLKQFEGLCHSNVNPTDEEKFPTTNEDLQGFWDMVNLQIEHVDSLFKELDLLKANNWQKTKDSAAPFVPTGSKLMKRPVVKSGSGNGITPPKTSPNAILIAQKRDAQRKQLLEMKRKNTALNKGGLSSPIEIYVSENFV